MSEIKCMNRGLRCDASPEGFCIDGYILDWKDGPDPSETWIWIS